MRVIILSLMLCSAVWAQETTTTFNQRLYDQHRSRAKTYVVGAACLTAVSLTTFMSALNWNDMVKEIDKDIDELSFGVDELEHTKDIYEWNRDRLLITGTVSLVGAAVMAYMSVKHDNACRRMVRQRISISIDKDRLGLAVHF
jgi:hypothetical protein